MEFTYIKKNVKGYYVTFPNQFIDELYNNIGTTYEDFLDNKWVLLNQEQLDFKAANPKASVEEVFNMELKPAPERTLEQAKSEKLSEISTVLENQFPSINTAALYEEINEENAGTLEDPIPYNNNMELKMGKYYSQDGVIYLCTRDTGQAVYNPLKDLVGIYVEVATA